MVQPAADCQQSATPTTAEPPTLSHRRRAANESRYFPEATKKGLQASEMKQKRVWAQINLDSLTKFILVKWVIFVQDVTNANCLFIKIIIQT